MKRHGFQKKKPGVGALNPQPRIQANAVLNHPSTYEVLKPEDFGLKRYIHIASRLTGWNAIKSRAEQLGIILDDEILKRITEEVKHLADQRELPLDEVDRLIYDARDEDSMDKQMIEINETERVG